MNKDTLKMTMLLDFYGDMLTEKQRQCYGLYYNEDLSLTEIAEMTGITKQCVHNIIIRASKKMTEIEEKTGIIQRWTRAREELKRHLARNGATVPKTVTDYFELENRLGI
ncbi:MAG: DNA-binding protein [Oscillospiraceae bacterium]|nr:DNA-binding protein [Oscillospiraceae bacterium]